LAELREKLVTSKAAAIAAKEAFKSLYIEGHPDLAVGLGLNRAKSDWAVKVFAQSPSAGAGLPDHFDDFEVDIEVTGTAAAFR